MQLRYDTNLTSERYVSEEAWRHASLERCPWHPEGGCSFKRNGTYGREEPPGIRVPRWYCPRKGRTVSLLPDFLAAKLPGTLAEVEQVVRATEQSKGIEAVADKLRPDVQMPGRLRWVRRRLGLVYAGLRALTVLLPEKLNGCEPTIGAFRKRIGATAVLPKMRAMGAAYLQTLPPPIGFGPRSQQHWGGIRAAPARG